MQLIRLVIPYITNLAIISAGTENNHMNIEINEVTFDKEVWKIPVYLPRMRNNIEYRIIFLLPIHTNWKQEN